MWKTAGERDGGGRAKGTRLEDDEARTLPCLDNGDEAAVAAAEPPVDRVDSVGGVLPTDPASALLFLEAKSRERRPEAHTAVSDGMFFASSIDGECRLLLYRGCFLPEVFSGVKKAQLRAERPNASVPRPVYEL